MRETEPSTSQEGTADQADQARSFRSTSREFHTVRPIGAPAHVNSRTETTHALALREPESLSHPAIHPLRPPSETRSLEVKKSSQLARAPGQRGSMMGPAKAPEQTLRFIGVPRKSMFYAPRLCQREASRV